MKKSALILGYIAAVSITIASVFKMLHFPGAGITLLITGLFFGIYFPVYILSKLAESNNGNSNTSHYIAALSAALIDVGVTFKIWHFSGAGICLVLGIGLFALLFIPMIYLHRSKQAGTDSLMNISGSLGLSAYALGVLCKLQHWPAASVLLVLGLLLLFLIYFPKRMMNKTTNPEVRDKELRTSFFVIVVAVLVILYFIKSIELHNPSLSNGSIPESPAAQTAPAEYV